LYRDELNPEQPGREWFFHLETLRGSIKLPPEIALPPEPPKRPNPPACLRDHLPREGWSDTDRHDVENFHKAIATFKEQEREFWPQRAKAMLPIFEHVKQRGFPTHEEGGFPYEFDVCAWLPGDLNPVEDPQNERLLPVPKRALTETEKTVVLAAVYDAHWRGSEKVAPWGVSEGGDGPEVWPTEAERDERRAALGYYFLVREAEKHGAADLPIVRSWLDEVRLAVDQTGTAADERQNETGVVLMLDDPQPDPTRAVSSADCRAVAWYGTIYTFTATQAACVKALIEHYEKAVCDVGESTILEIVESSQNRLASVFDNGKHPAWGAMIVPGSTKGTFRLKKPEKTEPTAKPSGTPTGTP